MKIFDAGHRYGLNILDKQTGDRDYLDIQFVKRMGTKFPFNHGNHSGTNCQEVLRVLIDRCEYLNNQKRCAETEAIIGNLRSALLLFELRAAREHNKLLNLTSTQEAMSGQTCLTCGHLTMNGHETCDKCDPPPY